MSKKVRLDIELHRLYPSISRSQLQRFIAEGLVKVNGEVITKSRQLLHLGDNVELEKGALDVQPAKIDLPIIYEDKDCVVIDKPTGILSHSKGTFNPEATVATWLADKLRGKIDDNQREGIVHRLDRATSGVMILAKNEKARLWLQKQFSSRKVEKIYVARVEGKITPSEAKLDLPIARNPKNPRQFRVDSRGKPAQTEYKLLKTFDHDKPTDSIIELHPFTGRTHQLRVHLKYIGHPIVGDILYAGRPANRMYLHAHYLKLTLPSNDIKNFKSSIPDEFNGLSAEL